MAGVLLFGRYDIRRLRVRLGRPRSWKGEPSGADIPCSQNLRRRRHHDPVDHRGRLRDRRDRHACPRGRARRNRPHRRRPPHRPWWSQHLLLRSPASSSDRLRGGRTLRAVLVRCCGRPTASQPTKPSTSTQGDVASTPETNGARCVRSRAGPPPLKQTVRHPLHPRTKLHLRRRAKGTIEALRARAREVAVVQTSHHPDTRTSF
jgi:hypothetical protein